MPLMKDVQVWFRHGQLSSLVAALRSFISVRLSVRPDPKAPIPTSPQRTCCANAEGWEFGSEAEIFSAVGAEEKEARPMTTPN